MELSYAAYNYPSGAELPGIPGAFMGDVDYTAADVLINHGFGNIIEPNYTSADCGAHTIAYRDIEYVVTENTNNNNVEVEENDDISTFDCASGTMIQWSLYDSSYNIGSDTGSSQLTNTKQLVVVAIRGSVTDSDWDNNMITQFVPCDNKFAEMKNDVEGNIWEVNYTPVTGIAAHTIGHREIVINENSEQNTTGGIDNDRSSEITVYDSGNIDSTANQNGDRGSGTGQSNVSTISTGSDSESANLTTEWNGQGRSIHLYLTAPGTNTTNDVRNNSTTGDDNNDISGTNLNSVSVSNANLSTVGVADTLTGSTDSESDEIRQLVVVSVRGSVSMGDRLIRLWKSP